MKIRDDCFLRGWGKGCGQEQFRLPRKIANSGIDFRPNPDWAFMVRAIAQ